MVANRESQSPVSDSEVTIKQRQLEKRRALMEEKQRTEELEANEREFEELLAEEEEQEGVGNGDLEESALDQGTYTYYEIDSVCNVCF